MRASTDSRAAKPGRFSYLRGMYRLVTKYFLLGLRHEGDSLAHPHMALTPILNAPREFQTEQEAFDWALNNHDDMRHHRDFVVLPVHHMVLTD